MPAPEPAFWLLTGDTPAGPFPLPAVHAKLAAGEVTWDTRACAVGASAWLPLRVTPGIGPAAADPPPVPPSTPTDPLPVAARLPDDPPPPRPGPPAARPPAATGSRAAAIGAIVVILAAVAAAGYGLYEAVRPLSPREVYERFDRAKTAAEAKKYATPAFQPVVDTFWGTPDGPDDHVEYTHDGPAPPQYGGHFIGMRGDFFVPEAGRRMRIDGVVHMVDKDGWKVNDFLFLAADGQRIDPPLSLAAEARGPGGVGGRPAPATQATRAWYDDPANRKVPVGGIFSFVKAGGPKAVWGAVLLVGGGIWALARRAAAPSRPPA